MNEIHRLRSIIRSNSTQLNGTGTRERELEGIIAALQMRELRRRAAITLQRYQRQGVLKDQARAATTLQAVQRGRAARRAAEAQLSAAEAEAAAAKLQALQRGHRQRLGLKRRREAGAATTLQAAQRGRAGRREAEEARALRGAATALQAAQRGRAQRLSLKRKKVAALGLQRVARGRAGRKPVRSYIGVPALIKSYEDFCFLGKDAREIFMKLQNLMPVLPPDVT